MISRLIDRLIAGDIFLKNYFTLDSDW